MLKSPRLNRRQILLSGLAAPATAMTASPAFAAAEMMGVAFSRFNRMKLGGFEVTTLMAATRVMKAPQNIFGMTTSPEDFAAASAKANIPADKAQGFFTPTVVNTGTELILFDTGLNPAGITAALTAAGYAPEQIDVVVITHMHGDHIGGLTGENGATFPNARYITGALEFDAWDMTGNERFEAKVRPLQDRMSMIDDGASIAPGVTAMAAFGHTPGHMTYLLESEGRRLLIAADFANHYVWSLAYPDWVVKFDRDKDAAAATRKRILDMLATEKMPFIGYHMPWPSVGYVERRGDGFHYVPATYQLML